MRRLHHFHVARTHLGRPANESSEKDKMVEKVPVIIPARNEEKTIGAIVRVFNEHPQTMGMVYVALDSDTSDFTEKATLENGGIPIHTMRKGKGQVVRGALFSSSFVRRASRLMLCDGDYTGLTPVHIDKMLRINDGITIGVPDWPRIPVPSYVTISWPQVSGFRYLPRFAIPRNAHGYLLETQININAIKNYLPRYLVMLDGLKAPFQWPLTPKRVEELKRDKEWGEKHGVL